MPTFTFGNRVIDFGDRKERFRVQKHRPEKLIKEAMDKAALYSYFVPRQSGKYCTKHTKMDYISTLETSSIMLFPPSVFGAFPPIVKSIWVL